MRSREKRTDCTILDNDFNECMSSHLPTANRYIIIAVICLTIMLFLIDWAIWGGNLLIGSGHFYMDMIHPALPHLRIHHFHWAILMWGIAGVLFIVMYFIRPSYCCHQSEGRHATETVLSVMFWFLIVGGFALFIRDLNDVVYAFQYLDFFPDPPW